MLARDSIWGCEMGVCKHGHLYNAACTHPQGIINKVVHKFGYPERCKYPSEVFEDLEGKFFPRKRTNLTAGLTSFCHELLERETNQGCFIWNREKHALSPLSVAAKLC